MKAIVESAVFSHSFGGQDGKPEIKVHNVVAGGTNYQCWAPAITGKIGQEIEFEVIPSKDPSKYPARIKLAEVAGKSFGGGKAPYVAGFSQTKEGAILSAKTMVLSYTKDIIIAQINNALIKPTETQNSINTLFNETIKLLALDQIKDAPKEAPAAPQMPTPTKSLTQMLAEISKISTVPAFSTWWTANNPFISTLSAGDKQILFASKAQRIVEIEQTYSEVGENEIPFN